MTTMKHPFAAKVGVPLIGPPPRRRAAVATILAVAPAAGCTVHERGFDDPVAMPAAFVEEAAADGYAAVTPDRWWLAFQDDALAELQELALAGNFDLATFRDRLRAARALVDREGSLLLPTLDGAAFGERTWRSSGDDVDGYGLSAIGEYEVDVWKRNASIVDSAELRRAVVREQLEAAAIALSAEVALTWYTLVEQRGQARVLDDQIETNEKVLRVVRTRFGSGVVRASDVLRQERLLESTREQRVVVRGRIEVLENALLVLVGRAPTDRLEIERDVLPGLPPGPALGLPAELVQRRPDVRSAYHAIQAADADVAVAVADRYPSVTLRFEASTIEEQIADLFDDWFALISVDVLGPLFDGGRREAEVRRVEAVKAERVNVYAQTILVAFRQVADAISLEATRDEQILRIERQLDLARRTSQRLNREYLNGDISYIDVLEALTTEQQLQRDLLFARLQRIGDRIALYQALAGGWEGIVPPDDDKDATSADDGPSMTS